MDNLRRQDQGQAGYQGGGMMMRVRKGESKPAGAVLMTDEDVLSMQYKTIMNWQPRSEMWPFSWGLGILGGTGAVSGMIVNSICRQRLGLGSMGRLPTFAPSVGLPVVLSFFFHRFLITNSILVGDYPCTVCAAVRSGAFQVVAGCIYPCVLAPLVSVVTARKYHTYLVPGIRDTAQLLPFVRHVLPGPGVLLALLAVNFGLGLVISERETLLFAKYLCPSSSSVERSNEDEFFR